MRTTLITIYTLALCLFVNAQSSVSDLTSGIHANAGISGSVKFSPVSGYTGGAVTICLYSGTICGHNLANTDIFYTLDGSAVTPASTWYPNPCANSSGCISLTAPTTGSTPVVIHALLVQTTSTSAALGCSTPCVGVVVQDGTNVKSRLKLNLSCTSPSSPSAQCANTVFTNVPTIQYGSNANPANGNNGVRGVPTSVLYASALSQPTVDIYGDTGTTSDYEMGTAGSTLSSGPNTEILINYDTSINEISSTGCGRCTNFDISRYVAHHYTGNTSSTLNPANLGDLETDHNFYDYTQGTSAQCTTSPPTQACYGAFNVRCEPADTTVTIGGVKYGGYTHSSQTSDWRSFPPSIGISGNAVVPSHDCTYPFGATSAITDFTSCSITFTPGSVNYNGQQSWGIESGAFLLIDQGTAQAETIYMTSTSGNAITGCIRGVGGSAHTHLTGAHAVETVLLQIGAVRDTTLAAGGSSQATCTTGTREKTAMYYNYMSINNHVYGTLAGQALLPGTTILDTWGTQQVNGSPHSKLCDYYGLAQIYDYGSGRFFDQIQPYTKLAAKVSAQIGVYTFHDNVTAHFGIIGTPVQWTGTIHP